MKITIETIPHEDQRYETVGDWMFNSLGDLFIRVSDMGDWKKEFLVALHELVEVALCKDRGITQEQVDAFDKAFEANRAEGNHDEPGHDGKAPYRKEHFIADIVERLMCSEFGMVWKEYDDTIVNI